MRLVAVLVVAGAALLLAACGSDDEDSGDSAQPTIETDPLRVEAAEGPRGTELIVYVIGEGANEPATAGGRKKVELRCSDKSGTTIVRKAHRWPFTDTDNGLTDPHVHQRVPRTRAVDVTRCELGGTRGPLRGELSGTGFE